MDITLCLDKLIRAAGFQMALYIVHHYFSWFLDISKTFTLH